MVVYEHISDSYSKAPLVELDSSYEVGELAVKDEKEGELPAL